MCRSRRDGGQDKFRNLHFTTALEDHIALADMVSILVNIPTKTKDPPAE